MSIEGKVRKKIIAKRNLVTLQRRHLFPKKPYLTQNIEGQSKFFTATAIFRSGQGHAHARELSPVGELQAHKKHYSRSQRRRGRGDNQPLGSLTASFHVPRAE